MLLLYDSVAGVLQSLPLVPLVIFNLPGISWGDAVLDPPPSARSGPEAAAPAWGREATAHRRSASALPAVPCPDPGSRGRSAPDGRRRHADHPEDAAAADVPHRHRPRGDGEGTERED